MSKKPSLSQTLSQELNRDFLQVIPLAGASSEFGAFVNEPIKPKKIFETWQKISCARVGGQQNATDNEQTLARNSYSYKDSTGTIVCSRNSDSFSGFISPISYAPDYTIEYQLIGTSGDDDGLFFIAGYMIDGGGKFHTISVLRTGDSETKDADPITDVSQSSHGYRFAICYDVYDAWAKRNPKTSILAYTNAPIKATWKDNTCNCLVKKTSTSIVAKTSDPNSADLKYEIQFDLPATKPSNWSQEQFNNVKYMMENSSKIGFGTESNACEFKILSQEGELNNFFAYNTATGKKETYSNGTKIKEEIDNEVFTPRTFVYSSLTKKLYYIYNNKTIIPLDLA